MKKQPTPYKCHIFVCTNTRKNNPENPGCGVKNGNLLKNNLKDAVSTRGWIGKVRVSTTGCLGLCAQGPNVLLQPHGIWFSSVTETDLENILDVVGNFVS